MQGVGAAIAAPSTLALLTTTFREGRGAPARSRYYSAVAGGGGSVGLVLGGVLTDWLSWRWGLFINVPIGLAVILLAPRFLPETERARGRFDLAGAVTSTLGMTALVYGFVRAAADGWSDRGTVASFAAGAVLLAAFVLIEARAEQPITPLHLFASRQRTGAYAARVLVIGGMFSMFFFLTQFLQGVRRLHALEAGFAFLPMTAVMFAMGRAVPRSRRASEQPPLTGGMLLAVIGIAWLSRISEGTDYFPGHRRAPRVARHRHRHGLHAAHGRRDRGRRPGDAGAASGLLNVAAAARRLARPRHPDHGLRLGDAQRGGAPGAGRLVPRRGEQRARPRRRNVADGIGSAGDPGARSRPRRDAATGRCPNRWGRPHLFGAPTCSFSTWGLTPPVR